MGYLLLEGSGTTVPGAPTTPVATAGNATATVVTSATTTGGSPITLFTATSNPGNIQATSTTGTINYPANSLTNGVSYNFTVTAKNVVGTSLPSAISNSVTPATVPAAPTIGTATAGNTSATITATPNSNGGSPITLFTAISNPGNIQATSPTSPVVYPANSLTNGTAYTFTMKVSNVLGISVASAPSNSVTPTAAGNVVLYANGVESPLFPSTPVLSFGCTLNYTYAGTSPSPATGSTQSLQVATNTAFGGGWQPASIWGSIPPNGFDDRNFTALQFSLWTPNPSSMYVSSHYSRSTGNDIPGGTSLTQGSTCLNVAANTWVTVTAPLANLALLGAANEYKFAIGTNAANLTFYVDNVTWITGSYAWAFQGTSAPASGWSDASFNGTADYTWLPSAPTPGSGFYPAGHWVAANQTLQMIYPLTDAVTSANARHHWAYYDGTNAIQYQIPIVAMGGSYPYVFTIDSASAALGMTIGAAYGSTNYGVLSWTPSAAVTGHTVTVGITDQQMNTAQAVFTLSTSSAASHFVFLDAASGSDSGSGTYSAPWQTLQKAFGSVYQSTGAGAGAICYCKSTGTYPTSGVKYTDSTDINNSPWFEMNTTTKPVALIGLGGQAVLDWTSGLYGLALGTSANDFFSAYLNPTGYSTGVPNPKWWGIYSGAGQLRAVDWNCTWSNSGYGSAGSDNATGHFGNDIGGSSLRSYIALLNFTETNRQSGSPGNNYPGHSLYSCDHWVSDGFTINSPSSTYDSICYAKGTNTNFEMRNHFINVAASGSGGVCSTPGFSAGGEPTSTSGEVRYCTIGQGATSTNQKIGTQAGTYGTFYLNRNTLIGQFQNGFGGTGFYTNNVVQTTGTPIPTGGGSTSSGNVTATSGIINSTTLQLQGSALSSVGTAGAQIA